MTKFLIYLRTAFLCSALLLIYHTSYGQTIADTLELEEIQVVATRIQQPLQLQPTNVQVLDSTLLRLHSSQNLGEILNSSSTMFIKSNGPGGLATASQRGLSAEQIQVLWEGIPINNLMLGLTDLSLLPASMFSGVQVSSGNPSSAFGGGSMSGAIYLASDFKAPNRLSFRQGIGSFGQWQSSLNGQYHSGKWQVGLRSVISRADNDFEYYNDAYDRYEHRKHNRREQENVMATVGYESGVKQFETKFWIQNSNNQIPGSILETSSRARQDDQALRWLSSYRTRWKGVDITLKSYLDRVELNYFDPEVDTRSLSTFRRWLSSAAFDYKISKYALLKGEVSGGISGVETNNYAGLKTRRQLSVLLNPEFSVINHRLKIYPALRFDSYSDFGSVLSPSLGLNYELLYDKLYLRGQLSRDFNPPTFNALYWERGGNPDLKAEYGRGAEVGLNLKPHLWLGFETIGLTAYYNDIENGIRWHPNAGDVFTASNIAQMRARGVEAQTEHRWYLPYQMQVQFSQSLSFNRTEITEPRSADDAAVGSQLRYVPQWKYNGSLILRKGIATALLQYRWVSRRFVTDTEDLGSSLDPYGVVDARLQLQKTYFGIQFKAQAGINNILGEDYEILQWYAMPQRNYNFSITATYQF